MTCHNWEPLKPHPKPKGTVPPHLNHPYSIVKHSIPASRNKQMGWFRRWLDIQLQSMEVGFNITSYIWKVFIWKIDMGKSLKIDLYTSLIFYFLDIHSPRTSCSICLVVESLILCIWFQNIKSFFLSSQMILQDCSNL